MARIDRRVSPNQTALWTVYELVAIQSARLARRVRSTVTERNRDSRPKGVVRWLVGFVVRTLREAMGRGHRPHLMRPRISEPGRTRQDHRALRVPLAAVNHGQQWGSAGSPRNLKIIKRPLAWEKGSG